MFFFKSNLRRPKSFLLIFAGVFFLDQTLKILFLSYGQFQKNYGALFGLPINQAYAAFALAAFLAGAFFLMKNKNGCAHCSVALALILSGIASNVTDKISRGFIVDYINFFGLCIFNVADLAILAGVIFFIWRILQE